MFRRRQQRQYASIAAPSYTHHLQYPLQSNPFQPVSHRHPWQLPRTCLICNQRRKLVSSPVSSIVRRSIRLSVQFRVLSPSLFQLQSELQYPRRVSFAIFDIEFFYKFLELWKNYERLFRNSAKFLQKMQYIT